LAARVELRDYLRILRKNWILIVALTLAGVGGSAAYSIASTPDYQSSTQLFVSVQTSQASTTGDLYQGSNFAQQKVKSYVDVVTSPLVLAPVIDELDLDVTPGQLAKLVEASSPLDTVLIDIAVTNEDPQLAANIADAVADSTAQVVEDLESPTDGGASPVRIRTIAPAVAPTAPSSPNVPLNLALGLLVGLALGVGIAVLRTVLDTRIHGPRDVEAITPHPILGGIGADPEAKKRPLIVQVDPGDPRAEAFRSVRTNLQFVNFEDRPRSMVITSAVPGEGKSTTTANLAITMAESGAKVAIIDADLRMPRIAEYLGIEGAVGLTDVLIGRAQLRDALQRWGKGHLFALPAGRIPPNPSELLGSQAMVRLLKEVTEQFDFVLIDAPPLLPVTDAAVLGKFAGGTIVVTAAGETTKGEFGAALRTLDQLGNRVLGIVINMLPTKGPDAYAYGSYYGKYYGGVEELEPARVR
jgi:succinoglycan biosynthesis transport protein ExoP